MHHDVTDCVKSHDARVPGVKSLLAIRDTMREYIQGLEFLKRKSFIQIGSDLSKTIRDVVSLLYVLLCNSIFSSADTYISSANLTDQIICRPLHIHLNDKSHIRLRHSLILRSLLFYYLLNVKKRNGSHGIVSPTRSTRLICLSIFRLRKIYSYPVSFFNIMLLETIL